MKSLLGIRGIRKLINATYGKKCCQREHMKCNKTQYQLCYLTKQYNMVKVCFKANNEIFWKPLTKTQHNE